MTFFIPLSWSLLKKSLHDRSSCC